jgi:anti-sigma-K factor RsiG
VDSFPDPRKLSKQELAELIDVLTRDEQETEYLRGVARRKVRLFRAELARRSGSADDGLS